MPKTLVIFPGGFHPFHKGHKSVYDALTNKFSGADVYVASSPSTKERPFPFEQKRELAAAAGVPSDKFIEVKSPYKSEEITKDYDADKDTLIFALSKKDADRLSYEKKDGSPGYFQPYKPGLKMQPFAKHAYVYIAPVKPFTILGKEVISASVIRKVYKEADQTQQLEIIKELYPKGNAKKIKAIFDNALMESDWSWFFDEHPLQEAHIFHYKYWGWIDPKGKLVLPNETDKTHTAILIRVTKDEKMTEMKACDLGWVRWLIDPDSDEMYFNSRKIQESSWSAIVKTMTSVVEKYPNCPLYTFEWFPKHIKRIEEGDASVFLKKVKNIFRKAMTVSEMIVHTKKGYVLYSLRKHNGKRKKLGGPYPSKEGAVKRERQVQYFKHMGEHKKFADLVEELAEGHPIPDKVKEAAQEGIDLIKEFKRGGNPAAIQMAKMLLSNQELSLPKVKAMNQYFFRHKTKVQHGESGHRPSSKTIPSNEYIAWMLYGGNPGRDWVERIVNPKKAEKNQPELNTDIEDQQ